MKPSEIYSEIIKQSGFEPDSSQQHSLTLLDNLQQQILLEQDEQSPSWWRKLITNKKLKSGSKGLYLWGGVGRGKTFLMDIFFQSLPIKNKTRCHFHQFMNEIQLALKQTAKRDSPLLPIAEKIASRSRVLCLDEFVIIDIADAMIMSGLLDTLFELGVVLVTTSNSPPENLYRDGLQRARFLPAIKLIQQNCEVVNLDGGMDYRLQGLRQTHLYTTPHSSAVVNEITNYLANQVEPYQSASSELTINGRRLKFQSCAEDTVWFSFDELCNTSRSQKDYLELARLFNTLILSDIEIMSAEQDDAARRFLLLIDILYDHQVILICSAAAPPNQLYRGKRLAFEFERTASRLIEMQSEQYLARSHSSH